MILTWHDKRQRFEFECEYQEKNSQGELGRIMAKNARFRFDWENKVWFAYDAPTALKMAAYCAYPQLRSRIHQEALETGNPSLRCVNSVFIWTGPIEGDVMVNGKRVTVNFKDLAKGAGLIFAKPHTQTWASIPRDAAAGITVPVWWTTDPEKAMKCSAYADETAKTALRDMIEKKRVSLAASRATNAEIVIPVPEGIHPRTRKPFEYLGYQKAGVAYAIKRPKSVRGTLFGDEMGLGKSVEAIGFINYYLPRLPDEQIKNLKILVICPASLKLNWAQEMRWWLVRPLTIGLSDTKRAQVIPNTNVVITNFEQLGQKQKTGKMIKEEARISTTGLFSYESEKPETITVLRQSLKITWDVLIVDECFPYDTMVLTTIGYRSIGEIVENGLDVYVASCDLSTDRLEWRRIQRWIRKPRPNLLYKITHEHGTFVCTGNHKIWTERGYIQAQDLLNGDCLRMVREARNGTQAGQVNPEVLQSDLLRPRSQRRARKEVGGIEKIIKAFDRQILRMVRGPLRDPIQGEGQQGETFLQYVMRCLLAHVSTGKVQKPISNNEDEGKRIWTESARSLSPANDSQQPNQRPERDSENERLAQGTDISGAWGQWATDGTTEAISRGSESPDGVRDHYGASQRQVSESAKSLQSGHRRPDSKSGDRSGRQEPRYSEMAFSRQAQDGCFERSRVVSVEIQKQRGTSRHSSVCPGGPFVYNLEIADNHNYFADGVLVSNCHRIKNEKTLRAKLTLSIVARHNLFLSGTPLVNRPRELWVLAHHLAPSVFVNKWDFLKRYCDGGGSYFGNSYDGGQHLDELQEKMRTWFMIRRLKKDVLTELPPKRRQVIELPATGCEHLVSAELIAWESKEAALRELKLRVELAKASDRPEDYTNAVNALRQGIKVAFEEMSKVRHDTAIAKIPAVRDHIAEALSEGNKVILFAHHKEVVYKIAQHFASECVTLTGDTKMGDRDAAVRAFQENPKVTLFIGTIMAAGVGLTLTASSHVVFAELDWVPGNVTQAEDRAHRIGQLESVLIQHLVLEGSLDKRMADTLIEKQEVSDQALDRETGPVLDLELVSGDAPTPVYALPDKDEFATHAISRKDIDKDVEKITRADIEAVHMGIRILAERCDGATAEDGAGFARFDVTLGHTLAKMPKLTPRFAILGKKLLQKYSQTQLAGIPELQRLFTKEKKTK